MVMLFGGVEILSESLPQWVAQEIKDARWEYIGHWKYSGYILDLYPRERLVDVQFYDRLPEGRYIATLEVLENYPMDSLQKGIAYVFEFKVFSAGLSERLSTFLKDHYSMNLKTIYRFELMSVESLG
jgi:hypothetical protein